MEEAESKESPNEMEESPIRKTIIREGIGEEYPREKQEASLLITSMPPIPQIPRTSDPRLPYKYIIDTPILNRGINKAVKSMRMEEISKFYINEGEYELSHDVEVTIELLEFYDKRKLIMDEGEVERYNWGIRYKELGNNAYKDKKYNSAIYAYSEGVRYLNALLDNHFEKSKGEFVDLWISLLNNMSLVYKAMLNYAVVELNSSYIIDKVKTHPKAYYLRGIANAELGNFEKGFIDFETALSLSGGDKGVLAEYQKYKKEQKKANSRQGKSYSQMFSPDAPTEAFYPEKESKITTTQQDLPKFNPSNPRIYMKIQSGFDPPSTIICELFRDKTPRTAENFRCLCTGEKSSAYEILHYRNRIFHKILKDFMIQGGDIERENGIGCKSIYGNTFEDENFLVPHRGAGILSMANTGKDTNASQFFITFRTAPWCDGKNVAFGRVIEGLDYILNLNMVDVFKDSGLPRYAIRIVECGNYVGDVKEEWVNIGSKGYRGYKGIKGIKGIKGKGKSKGNLGEETKEVDAGN